MGLFKSSIPSFLSSLRKFFIAFSGGEVGGERERERE